MARHEGGETVGLTRHSEPESTYHDNDHELEDISTEGTNDSIFDEKVRALNASSPFWPRMRSRLPSREAYKAVILALRPSFIAVIFAGKSTKSRPKQGIAVLDGLRWLACLFVFNEHFTTPFHNPKANPFILHTPYIRLLWYGRAMVSHPEQGGNLRGRC